MPDTLEIPRKYRRRIARQLDAMDAEREARRLGARAVCELYRCHFDGPRKKLIHIDVDNRGQLICDDCGYELGEGWVKWGEHLIGFPCPQCEANMLTRLDYENSEKMFRVIAWINRWFGWLGSRTIPATGGHRMSMRTHNGKMIVK